ncbi:MAG: potassium/proton antiporter [Alphaproteobacteria bacterium]
MIDNINLAILVISFLITISILTSIISMRFGAPLLLIFLLIGFIAGEDGPGRIYFNNSPIAYLIGTLSLVIILFDSGFSTKIKSWKNAAPPALTLSTLGVILTTLIVGYATHILAGFSWPVAFLTGSIVSSTDAAAVFFLLRAGGIQIKEKVKSTLELESGSNDPMAILLTFFFLEMSLNQISQGNIIVNLVEIFLKQIGLGLFLGFIGAHIIIKLVNTLKIEVELYPLIVLCLVFVLFALVSLAGGSGFLAVYVAGIITGNAQMRVVGMIHRFHNVMTWLGQIFMFLTLGLLATPSQFLDVLGAAIMIAFVLIFIARPLAVWLCLKPFDFNNNETAFLSWVGLRGAVSILLAILPRIYNIPESLALFNIAFVVVLTSLLIQGWTIKSMAKIMRLIIPPKIGEVERIELDLPNKNDLELVSYNVHQESAAANGQKIPKWVKPALIIRNNTILSQPKSGKLQPNDQIYIFASPNQIKLLDKLFARPANTEENDFLEDFIIKADASMKTLADTYGISIENIDQDITVGEYLEQKLENQFEEGDWLSLGSIEIIIRSLDDNHKIAEIGLLLDITKPDNNNLLAVIWQIIKKFFITKIKLKSKK